VNLSIYTVFHSLRAQFTSPVHLLTLWPINKPSTGSPFLAPKAHTVLGGHKVLLASGSILPELAEEFEAVRAGRLTGKQFAAGITQHKGAKTTFLGQTVQ
jgi:hypothetical protein